MNILLLGKGGQVGWELQRSLSPLGHITAYDVDTADFTKPAQVVAIVRALQPRVIVNAAAYTAVDQAEHEPELARLVNATTPGALAAEAAALGALMVHYSTDYVFDGSGHAPRDESAHPAPLSVYGQTKLEGERHIIDSGCRHLILRSSWVHATQGGNFAKTMLRLAAERDRLNVINDQFGAPTGADLLADITAHAVRAVQTNPSLGGLYHLVADGETSWYDYARFVIEWARKHGHAVRVAPEGVQPIPTSAYPTPARRPLNSRLSTSKLKQAFGLSLPHWQQGVERMLIEHLGRPSP